MLDVDPLVAVERRSLVRRQRRASARAPRSQSSPCGANSRPSRYANVVSSGAISPARAPHSIVMLQTVILCSIGQSRIAAPAYSTT